MNHNDIRHKLSEYLDGAVSDTDKTEIEAHLQSCPVCSVAFEELRKTVDQVKQVEEIEPPAWMTQKIMAKVREEAATKKSWYERFFLPFVVKVPVQAVAVLFLAVTAYYMYQVVNPGEQYRKAPLDKLERAKPAAPILSRAPEPKIQGESDAPAKKAPQAPGYKALDMKQEYEKPAPPMLLEKAGATAPAPADVPFVEAKRDTAAERVNQAVAPQPAATLAMQDKAERAMGAGAVKEMTQPHAALKKAKTAASEANEIRITLAVTDMAVAEKQVESIILELKGAVVRRETKSGTRAIVISLDVKMLGALQEKLGKLGALQEKEKPSTGNQGLLQVEIVLTTATRP